MDVIVTPVEGVDCETNIQSHYSRQGCGGQEGGRRGERMEEVKE